MLVLIELYTNCELVVPYETLDKNIITNFFNGV